MSSIKTVGDSIIEFKKLLKEYSDDQEIITLNNVLLYGNLNLLERGIVMDMIRKRVEDKEKEISLYFEG